MGFNPFRPAHREVQGWRSLDMAIVIGTIVVIALLLAWAIWA
jgi:hypothetical protein